MGKLFELGQLMETPFVNQRRIGDYYFNLFCRFSLDRFESGDWGDMDEEDKKTNDKALKNGERLMGSYIFDVEEVIDHIHAIQELEEYIPKKTEDKDPDGLKIWIVTEWDRSRTTILFPTEY